MIRITRRVIPLLRETGTMTIHAWTYLREFENAKEGIPSATYRQYLTSGASLPQTEAAAKEVFFIPPHPAFTDEEQKATAGALLDNARRKK